MEVISGLILGGGSIWLITRSQMQIIKFQKQASNVTTLKSSEDASKLKNTILTSEPNAKVEIDTDSQKVSIESEASAETFKQLITASGHQLK